MYLITISSHCDTVVAFKLNFLREGLGIHEELPVGEGSTLRISDTFRRFSPESSLIDVRKLEPAGMGRKDKSMPWERSGFVMGTRIAVELKGSIDSVAGGKGVRSPLPEKLIVNGSHC